MSTPLELSSPSLEKLLDSHALAEVLCLSVNTVRKLASPGFANPKTLPKAIRLGGKLRWDPAEVRRWIDAKYGRFPNPTIAIKKRGRPRKTDGITQGVR